MDFKKTLIATTAIVAVGGLSMATADAASKPKLKISGYYELFMGAGDGDRTGNTASGTPAYTGGEEGTFSIIHYGEIRFKASGKTDSGMKWGVYFEDVMNDKDTGGKKCSTDETNIWMSGSWGKLELGGQDGVADKNGMGSSKIVHINLGMVDAFADTDKFAWNSVSINDSSDQTKITYYTPRISGIQAGYSWGPDDKAKGSVGADSSNEQFHEASLSYSGKVGGGKLKASVVGARLPSPGSGTKSENGWRVGAVYSMGPWTIAGGGKHINNEGKQGEDGDKSGWNIGVAYSGGRYGVALAYMAQEAEDSAGDGDYYHVGLTGAYNLGGGLTVSAMLTFYDLDANGNSAFGTTDTNGTVGILAVRAKF